MENAIDDLLEPINTNYLNLDDFFILFQNPVSENEKKKNFTDRYNQPNDPFIESLLKNSNKRLQNSQKSKISKKTFDENDNELLNTISSRFDNVPYYEIFK